MQKNRRDTADVYKNDFLSVIVQPDPAQPGTYLCCFSVNIERFDRLSKGTYGIGSNPAFKGLQLLRADVIAFVLRQGVVPRSAPEQACSAIMPRGHGWYHENLMLENVPDALVNELVRFSVTTLVAKVLSVCRPEKTMPQEFLDSSAMQTFIESLEKT